MKILKSSDYLNINLSFFNLINFDYKFNRKFVINYIDFNNFDIFDNFNFNNFD